MPTTKKQSKFLSLILRHKPTEFGVVLDEAGWTDVGPLLEAMAKGGTPTTREELDELVATSDKKRFALSEDGLRIRANQGHSVEVELGLVALAPPEVLYHGTIADFLDGIRAQGLIKGSRHHVHLSADLDTAKKVGGRRGKPVILTVQSAKMAAAGHSFWRSENGVWLAEHVPAEFIDGL